MWSLGSANTKQQQRQRHKKGVWGCFCFLFFFLSAACKPLVNWESSPKVSVSGASLDAGVVSLALRSLTPLLSPRSSSHTQTEAHAESLHSTPRDPYGRSRGALILFVHLGMSLYRGCFFFFSFSLSSFSPSSTVSCRAAELLATLRQPLGLFSVRTRLPSLPLRAPNATAHASNSSVQRTYDWPT